MFDLRRSLSVYACSFGISRVFQSKEKQENNDDSFLNDGGPSAANNSRRASQSHKYTRMVTRHQSFPLPLVILEKKTKKINKFLFRFS
jgi:hypothetical protein